MRMFVQKMCCRLVFLLVLGISGGYMYAQQPASSVFEVFNLDYPGLEDVSKLVDAGDSLQAEQALLDYFRNRIEKETAGKKYAISKGDQQMADNALEHKFFSMSAYPSYFYGKDIDWTYWPVRDNELRWQLHRHKWFVPMGKAYRISGDEKYAEAWVNQYDDWMRKNPYPSVGDKYVATDKKSALDPKDLLKNGDENAQFAWRPLETCGRLSTLYETLTLMIPSTAVTSDFLARFFVSYDLHAEHVMNNFSREGNHLLFEAEYLIFAGCNFPELKKAESWRKKGIEIMKTQMDIQVYDDGVQYELDPGYHVGTVHSFYHAYQLAADKGFEKEFPVAYLQKIERMMEVTMNLLMPDYSIPMFSDAGKSSRNYHNTLFRRWYQIFPDNENFLYIATDGAEGKQPAYNSKAFKNGGFYIFRNGWKPSSTAMVLKAGPPARWHNQPDNGTFDLCMNGRLFFSDSGRYIYGGDSLVLAQRNWFRQTRVHNTLTLDSRNIEVTDSKCLLWDTSNPHYEVLVTENQGYNNMKHRRTVFFVDRAFFVIVDEALGDAEGTVNVNYQLGEEHVQVAHSTNTVYTDYADGNNMRLDVYTDKECELRKEEGWISYEYGKKSPRNSFSYNIEKKAGEAIWAVSIISPVEKFKGSMRPKIKRVQITVDRVMLMISYNGSEKKMVARLR